MSKELVVAKFGSDVVVGDRFDTRERLAEYANTLLAEYTPDNLVIVTSGAVALGSREIAAMHYNSEKYTPQQKAQIGSTAIAEAWKSAFKEQGIISGGLFVTHHELGDRREKESLLELHRENRRRGIVSIINENDALSVRELMKLASGGDNDGLAGHLAGIFNASALNLYTKKGGVFDDSKAIIPVITSANEPEVTAMLELRPVSPNSNGQGGIVSKHREAVRSSRNQIRVSIAPPPDRKYDPSKVTLYPCADS